MQTTLYMPAAQSPIQMMSYVIRTKEGRLIVIDGGNQADAGHLLELLIRLGGPEPVVDYWFLTHPHSDHVDALLEIYSRPHPLKVKGIYSSFLSYEFYKKYDFPGCTDARTTKAFEAFRQAHGELCRAYEKGQVFVAGSVEIHVLRVPDESFPMNVINNSSVVLRVDAEGQRILFIGDLGEEAGDEVCRTVPAEELRADFVQMAHHGQNGVKRRFYETVAPRACLWNTPQWLWDNDQGRGYDTGPWRTIEVQGWMRELGVEHHFIAKDGEHEIGLPYPFSKSVENQ